MGNEIRIKIELVCGHYDYETGESCGTTVDTTGTIKARIEDGGDIDISITPDAPDGWDNREYGSTLYCPKCLAKL